MVSNDTKVRDFFLNSGKIVLALCCAGLFGFIIVSGITSSDLDDVCRTNNNSLIKKNGQWVCDTKSFGEMWNKNDDGFAIIDLTAQDVYSQITNLTNGSVNGFTLSSSNLTVTNNGMYLVNGAVSLSAGGNGEFGVSIYKNTVGQNDCYAHSHVANGDSQSFGIACLLSLVAGDKIGLYVDDHVNPPNDPTIQSASVTLVKVNN